MIGVVDEPDPALARVVASMTELVRRYDAAATDAGRARALSALRTQHNTLGYFLTRLERPHTQRVEQHRFSFEGSTTQLADHLIETHALSPDVVSRWRGGMSQGDWVALDNLHRAAHTRGETS